MGFIFRVFQSETRKLDLIGVNQIPPGGILFGGMFWLMVQCVIFLPYRILATFNL